MDLKQRICEKDTHEREREREREMDMATVQAKPGVLCLEVTEEQRDVISALFNHYDWDLKELDIGSLSATTGVSQTLNGSQIQSSHTDDDLFMPGFTIPQDSDARKCPHCLCSPCITSDKNKQLWWPEENVISHQRNSGLRKIAYRKFWTMLHHRQVWVSPEYLERKTAALDADPQRKDYVYHRRDIMPDCVLKLVRGWYPNPPNMPYMGHMWE